MTHIHLRPVHGFILLLLIITLPLFAHLGEQPLRQWDESRLAINALEMTHNGDWTTTSFNGRPDMWNTKPPFLIWVQALFFKAFGYSEDIFRLPSAIAGALTCIAIYLFFVKKFKAPWLGLISCTVLVTSEGFINIHGERSGDYDTMLTLFTTLYCLSYFLYLENVKKKYLWLSSIFLILAALTKGIQALLFLPALLLYTIYAKKLLYLLRQKDLYFGLLAFLFFVLGYYLLREHQNPGYIHIVMLNEMGGRFNKVIENHEGDPWYYFDFITQNSFQEWFLLILPGFAFAFLSKDNLLRSFSAFCFLLISTYVLIISNGATKIWWYTMPLFPFLCMVVGIFIYFVADLLNAWAGWRTLLRFNCLPIVFVFLIFAIPYKNILAITLHNHTSQFGVDEDVDMAQFLKYVLHDQRNIDGAVVPDCYPQNLFWYSKVLTYQNRPIKFIKGIELDSVKKVVAFKKEAKEFIESHYKTHIIQTYASVIVYSIDGTK
jgi:4-amino-4-deoxy-L-arabinose transferase-like glycosyltransferase